MIQHFYVKATDLRCPMAHRFDCLPEEAAQIRFPGFEKYDNRYIVTYIDGLDAPKANITTNSMANQDGSTFTRAQVPERTVTIKVMFNQELEGPALAQARADLNVVFGVGNPVQLYMVDSTRCFGGAEPHIIEVAQSDWSAGQSVSVGRVMRWPASTANGIYYYCKQAHTTNVDIRPDKAAGAAYWRALGKNERITQWPAAGSRIYANQSSDDWDENTSVPTLYHGPTTNTDGASKFDSVLGYYYRWTGGRYELFWPANIQDNAMFGLNGNAGWTISGRVETHESDMFSNACWAQITIRCFDPRIYYWPYNRVITTNIFNYCHQYSYESGLPSGLTSSELGHYACIRYPSIVSGKERGWFRVQNTGTSAAPVYSWVPLYNSYKMVDGQHIKYFDPYYTPTSVSVNWSTWHRGTATIDLTKTRYATNPKPMPEVYTDQNGAYGVSVLSYQAIKEILDQLYGLEFHDACGIPVSLIWTRGSSYPAISSSDNYAKRPAIQSSWDETNENYIAPLANSCKWYVAITSGWANSTNRLGMYNEAFLTDAEMSATSWNVYLDKARLQYRNVISYTDYDSTTKIYDGAFDAISYVPADSNAWPYIERGTLNSVKMRLAFAGDNTMTYDVYNAYFYPHSVWKGHQIYTPYHNTGIRLDPYRMGI